MSEIKELKGARLGRNIVILGNGPSLNKLDFSGVVDPVFIGVNGSALFSKERGLFEEFCVLSDLRFVNDPAKMSILKDNLPKASRLVVRDELFRRVSAELENPVASVRSLGRDGFSYDLSKGYYFGCTTVMLGVQLAAYLGASNIYLCGVDLRYDPDKPRFYEESKVHSVDNFSCVQIHNLRHAFKSLSGKSVHLFGCSEESLLRPYLPYYDLKK